MGEQTNLAIHFVVIFKIKIHCHLLPTYSSYIGVFQEGKQIRGSKWKSSAGTNVLSTTFALDELTVSCCTNLLWVHWKGRVMHDGYSKLPPRYDLRIKRHDFLNHEDVGSICLPVLWQHSMTWLRQLSLCWNYIATKPWKSFQHLLV